MVRCNEFVTCGGFDECYRPAYFEDADYALRVEALGQRTRLIADTPVVHHHGAGGSLDGLAIGERSLATFRSIWGRGSPSRPRGPTLTMRRSSTETASLGHSSAGPHTLVGRLLLFVGRRSMKRDSSLGFVRVTELCSSLTTSPGSMSPVPDATAWRSSSVMSLTSSRRCPVITAWQTVTSRRGGIPPSMRALWSPWTALVALVGIVLRWWVLESPAGVLNSDEAYTGLATLGIRDGRFPIVIDGNRYTAVLEAYMFAPVLGVTGPSILALKLIPITFWAAASVLVYLAGTYLVSRRIGAVAGALVWITPGALLVVSTLAYISYALGMAIAVATLISAAHVIDREHASVKSSAILGALAGLGFYVHPMYLAVLLPLTLPVVWHHRRAGRDFWVPFVGAGVLVNLPFLAWNALNGFPSLEVQNGLPGTYTDRLDTFFRELVPRGYGLRDVSFEWVFGRNLGWLAYAVLVALVVVGCTGLVRRSDRRSRWLVPLTLIAVWPLMALFSPLIWSADGRYNVISFPFIAIAVASALTAIPAANPRWLTTAAVVLVAGWGAVFVWPHTSDVIANRSSDPNASLSELVDFLEAEGIDQVAGSYWRVLTVEYGSDRSIIGAVSPPEPVRFPDRQRTVQGSPPENVAFVFPPWAEDSSKLWMPAENYERVVVGDTVVYLPLARN